MEGTGLFKGPLVSDPEEHTTAIKVIAKETRLTEVGTIGLKVMIKQVMPVMTNVVMKEIIKMIEVVAMKTTKGIIIATKETITENK